MKDLKNPEKFYTTQEVGQMLGITARAVSRLCSQGKIRGGKVGISWRISESNLQAYMKAQGLLDE